MSGQVLYIEVYNTILKDILSSEYVENEPIPSERYLSEKYHVSRSTIRQALDKLCADGFIYTVHGNGSFVKPHMFEQPLNKFYSFTDNLKSSNTQIENNIIEYSLVYLDKHLAKKLNDHDATTFHKLIRLRLEKDYPLMIETTYLPKSRIYHLDIGYLEGRGSLYKYLADKYDFHADRATETFRPVLATQSERELLKINQNTPCMLIERFSYENNSIIEYTKSIVRGDKYTFKVDLMPNP